MQNRSSIRLIVVIGAMLAMPVVIAGTVDLSKMAADQHFFGLSARDFERKYGKLGFTWTSKTQRSARLAAEGVTVFGAPVVEALAHFDQTSATELKLAIYTRGDVGEMAECDYHRVVGTLKENLNRRVGCKAKQFRKSTSSALQSYVWQHNGLIYRMDAMSTIIGKLNRKSIQPEYITIRVFQYDKNKSLAEYGESKRLIDLKTVRANVRRAKNGDVWIANIPMIDQGDKGYCACAASARVLGYFGRTVDQHLLAKLAKSTNAGTDPEQLRKALKGLQRELNFKVRMLYDRSESEHLTLLKYYQRDVEKRGPPTARVPIRRPLNDLPAIYAKLDPRFLLSAAARRKTSVDAFRKQVKQNIDMGVPLLWTMVLGVIKEEKLVQAAGGHMRLIIGYNTERDEVIYSDTWGAGHERKHMPLLSAFAVTMGLDVIRAY